MSNLPVDRDSLRAALSTHFTNSELVEVLVNKVAEALKSRSSVERIKVSDEVTVIFYWDGRAFDLLACGKRITFSIDGMGKVEDIRAFGAGVSLGGLGF